MTSQWSAVTTMPVIPGLTRDPVPHVPWIADRVRNDKPVVRNDNHACHPGLDPGSSATRTLDCGSSPQ
jgi:hypothetical protein